MAHEAQEKITARDHTPEELISCLEGFLTTPDMTLLVDEGGAAYESVDLINRVRMVRYSVTDPDGYYLDTMPFVRISKEIEDDEVSYIVYRDARPHAKYRSEKWEETRYTMRKGALFMQKRDSRQAAEAIAVSHVAAWESEHAMSRNEVNEACERLMGGSFIPCIDNEPLAWRYIKHLGSKTLGLLKRRQVA